MPLLYSSSFGKVQSIPAVLEKEVSIYVEMTLVRQPLSIACEKSWSAIPKLTA